MKFGDLEPAWWEVAGRAVGVEFLCPVCRKHRLYIPIASPPDGGPRDGRFTIHWSNTGGLNDLTLTPSIDHKSGRWSQDDQECHWHGFVTNGEVRTC